MLVLAGRAVLAVLLTCLPALAWIAETACSLAVAARAAVAARRRAQGASGETVSLDGQVSACNETCLVAHDSFRSAAHRVAVPPISRFPRHEEADADTGDTPRNAPHLVRRAHQLRQMSLDVIGGDPDAGAHREFTSAECMHERVWTPRSRIGDRVGLQSAVHELAPQQESTTPCKVPRCRVAAFSGSVGSEMLRVWTPRGQASGISGHLLAPAPSRRNVPHQPAGLEQKRLWTPRAGGVACVAASSEEIRVPQSQRVWQEGSRTGA